MLLDDINTSALTDIYDPRPYAPRFSPRSEPDPFQDVGAPLRMALASDVAWLAPELLEQLLRLGQLPGVELHALPSTPFRHVEGVCRVSTSGPIGHWSAAVSCRPGSWRAIGADVSQRMDLASTMYPELGARGRRMVLEVMTHAASRSAFIVSDELAALRSGRSGWWLREMGVCSVDEAFRLAGTKARLYEQSVVHWWGPGRLSANIGMWFDWAIQRLIPSFCAHCYRSAR